MKLKADTALKIYIEYKDFGNTFYQLSIQAYNISFFMSILHL